MYISGECDDLTLTVNICEEESLDENDDNSPPALPTSPIPNKPSHNITTFQLPPTDNTNDDSDNYVSDIEEDSCLAPLPKDGANRHRRARSEEPGTCMSRLAAHSAQSLERDQSGKTNMSLESIPDSGIGPETSVLRERVAYLEKQVQV